MYSLMSMVLCLLVTPVPVSNVQTSASVPVLLYWRPGGVGYRDVRGHVKASELGDAG